MSEEKLYAVKNDGGKYWDTGMTPWWSDKTGSVFKRIDLALGWAEKYGGHVVTLIEASKPVEVSEKEAKMLATLMDGDLMPVCELSYFVRHAEQLPEKESIEREDRLMRAYVNGYTVVREKRYLVYKTLGGKQKHEYFAQAYQSTVNPGTVSWLLNSKVQSDSLAQFTEAEIEHYELQDCEKMEVKD